MAGFISSSSSMILLSQSVLMHGFEYYDILHENIIQRSFADIRLFHILYDHKAAMKIRLDFLTANHYIKEKNKDKLFATFNELYVSTTKVRNLAVKYQITSDDSILQRISAYCKELKQLDSSFTSYLLESLTMS
jgi:hypothetical protein